MGCESYELERLLLLKVLDTDMARPNRLFRSWAKAKKLLIMDVGIASVATTSDGACFVSRPCVEYYHNRFGFALTNPYSMRRRQERDGDFRWVRRDYHKIQCRF